MQVQVWNERVQLDHVPQHVVGFDLEMANSFQRRKGVVCMIGMGTYDAAQGQARTVIGSITDAEEEGQLIAWFLEELEGFAKEHETPHLLSFSGLDNDVPWINERLVRLSIVDPEQSILCRYGHIDLKREFYRRTHNHKISLKKLEEIFGIERTSEMTSKKVSFLLTNVLEGRHAERVIPPRIMEYLRQDVHHMLLILDQWASHPLDGHRMTDIEYLGLLNSLANQTQKLLASRRFQRDFRTSLPAFRTFAEELRRQYDRVLIDESFESFALPHLPEADGKHLDMARLQKKYQHLLEIPVRDKRTGKVRLRHTLDRPKGALAVVRHEGKLLMMRRAEHLERAAGLWGLPGGAFEAGETPAEAATRELWEELNLEGHATRILGSSTSFSGHFQLFWVEVDVPNITTLRPNADEVADVRWVLPHEVPRLDPLIPGAEDGIREFLGGIWAAKRRR